MPICIECCYPVSQLYHVLHSRNHKATAPPVPNPTHNKSTSNLASPQKPVSNVPKAPEAQTKTTNTGGGGDVRLTQCPRCKRFADKYVEHDFVVLFIDLVLVKPQVYRHLLFNRLSRDDDDKIDRSIKRLGTLLLLFDVYLTWSHIESFGPSFTANSPIPTLPVVLQYAFYFFLCVFTTLSQHLIIRWLALDWNLAATAKKEHSNEGSPNAISGGNAAASLPAPPKKPTPNSISTALFVSSCMSLFPILMVVWKYGDTSEATIPTSTTEAPLDIFGVKSAYSFLSTQGGGVDWVRRGVAWAVAFQNMEALRILLGCGYMAALGLVAAGGAAGWVVRSVMLGAVGLGAEG
ncbi:sterol homeostasis protein [Imshaugia aleurites]|uniref:Protein ARV n=1 Tax=Imshaugia aleurites TaxID=172621 RepID=A0A8H3G231_9LECA|nr:sterol homeostasis protein [Imshaugia aleurites]